MPKQPINIKQFDKGFVDKISDRDLVTGTLAEARNVDVSVRGVITNTSKFADAGSTLTSGSGGTTLGDSDLSLQPGYGIFTFKSDVAPKSGKNSGEHLVYTSGTGEVYINDSATSSGSSTLIEFDSSADIGSNVKAVYYYADGGLRISSNNFEANTDTRKQAFIRQSRNSSDTMYNTTLDDNMHLFTSGLAAPVTSTFTQFTPSTPDTASAGTTVANDIGLGIANVGSDGLWQPGNYAIGISYVYHNNQESLITNWTSNLDISEGEYPVVQISIDDDVLDTATQEKFIQGMRVYLRNLTAGDEEYVLLIDVDFEQGSRISLTDEFDAFNTSGTGFAITDDVKNDASGIMAYEVKTANIETYSTINGFSPNEHEIDFYNEAYGYKTAVVANQRVFVGNVKYKDAVGKTKIMGDRIQYTPTLRYDTFPQTYFIDIGANDGDEIVKLLEFRDRLFVYKKNKLFIINISSNTDAGWYLEGEFMNRGITSPNAVVKTDIGIIWANEHGLFAFSNGISKLSDLVKEETWRNNFNNDQAIVGFIPKKNQIMILKDANDMGDDGYLYDLQTKSFVNLDDSAIAFGVNTNNRPVSNFITLNNELCCFTDDTVDVSGSNRLVFFDLDTDVSQLIDIETPTFAAPESVDKKYYSVYVTYQNNGSNLYLRTKYDTQTDFVNSFTTSTPSTNDSFNRLQSSTLTTQEFVINEPVFKKSIALQITGTAETDFQLQDITIIARAKGIR